MKTANWIPFAFYSILLVLFTLISSGQTYEQTGNMFDVPDVAPKNCPKGDKWDGVQCLPFVH